MKFIEKLLYEDVFEKSQNENKEEIDLNKENTSNMQIEFSAIEEQTKEQEKLIESNKATNLEKAENSVKSEN